MVASNKAVKLSVQIASNIIQNLMKWEKSLETANQSEKKFIELT